MPKYHVTVYETTTYLVEVDADNPTDAQDMAKDFVTNQEPGPVSLTHECSVAQETDHA